MLRYDEDDEYDDDPAEEDEEDGDEDDEDDQTDDEYDDDQCKRFNKEIIKAYRRVKAFAYGEGNLFDLRRRIAEFESGLSNEGIKEKLNIFGYLTR